MVKSINVQNPVTYFKKFGSKNLPVNRDGSIKEIHDVWNDPKPKLPEPKPPNEFKPPPYIPYKHPPDYLIPIGNGIYTTPTDDPKVSDPQNCDGNLGDISPWCGNSPIDTSPLGLDVEVAYDECNVWVEISPTLAFLKLPPGQIAYRFPGKCREEPPPDPPPTADPGKKTYRKPKGLDPLASVFAFVGNDYGTTTIGQQYVEGRFTYKYRTFAYLTDWKFGWTDYKCPGTVDLYDMANSGFYYNSPITGFFEFTTTINNVDTYEGQTTTDSSTNTSPGKGEWDTTGGWGVYYPYIAISEDGKIISYRTKDGSVTQIQPVGTPIYGVFEAIGNGALTHQTGIFKGTWQIIDLYLGSVEAPLSTVVSEMPAGESATSGYANIHVDFVIAQNCGSTKKRSNLPPPPKTRRDCCMACCNQSSDNTLLKEILAQIKKANTAIGSDQLPASLPKVLNKDDNSTVTVNNLAELWKRGVVYLDGISGEYPLKIKIQDTDATTAGDQSAEMTFDNAAEMLAEQFGINMNTSINSELMIQLLSKTLVELSVVRKQLHNTQSAVKTLQDYFGFDCREAPEDIPLSITIPKSDKLGEFVMDDFLKESYQKVEVWKLSKGEVGGHKKKLLLLEKAANIIQSVFWKKLAGGDTKEALRRLLKRQNEVINDVDKHEKDLEDWLEKYEQGFVNEEGYIGDKSQPWGEAYEQRPKTKIIGKPNAEVKNPDAPST